MYKYAYWLAKKSSASWTKIHIFALETENIEKYGNQH